MIGLAVVLILLATCRQSASAPSITSSSYPEVTCSGSYSAQSAGISSCPFVPCSIAKCPRVPAAVCYNDYCGGGCNHRYYLNGADVTTMCDPCASLQCPPKTICYFDSNYAPYCTQQCSSTIPCPNRYTCRTNPYQYYTAVQCFEGSCGYPQKGYCVKKEGKMTVSI